MNDFETVAKNLIEKLGTSIPCSVVQAACARAGVDCPTDLPFEQTGKRGGRFDLSSYKNVENAMRTGEGCTSTTPHGDETYHTPCIDRFAALDLMTHGIVDGHYRALIVSGNPGIGKTYTLEQILAQAVKDKRIKKFTTVHGYTRATGLYRMLYNNRFKGNVVLFDDCDSVFGDETALNLLKAALDTTHVRTVSWHSEKPFKDEEGDTLPKSYEFEGTVIFVTNLNFDKALTTKLGPHLEALISRSYYLDLNMRSEEELLNRIETVLRASSLLSNAGLTAEAGETLLAYIKANRKSLREVSLRTVVKLANVLRASKDFAQFETMAKASCCRA